MIADEAAEFESKLNLSEAGKQGGRGNKKPLSALVQTLSEPKNARKKAAKAAKVNDLKLGQLIPEQFPRPKLAGRAKGGKPLHKSQPATCDTLADSGISRTQSSRWQKVAAVARVDSTAALMIRQMLPEHVGFSVEAHGAIQTVDFDFEAVDEALGFVRKAPPTAREQAAELFRQLATWCFRGNRPLRTATMKFAVIVGGLRADLLGDRTMGEIATELGCTKQNMAHQSAKFQDAFGIKFARSRSKEAREHMRRARLGGPARNTGKAKSTR
jgi:hypothetical protein